jgi:hypothetical protein
VAAELVVSNDDGLRWTAAVRTGGEVRFQPPPSPHDDPEHREAAARWDSRLVSWAVDPEQLDAAPIAAAPPGPAHLDALQLDSLELDIPEIQSATLESRQPGSPSALVAAAREAVTVHVETTATDPRVEELLARITRLEAQLASGVAGGRWEQLGRQVDAMVEIWHRTRAPRRRNPVTATATSPG